MTKPKGVFKRRKCKGNQHFRSNPLDQGESSSNVLPRPRPNHQETTQSRPSSSKTKLDESVHEYVEYSSEETNIIVTLSLLSDALSKFVVCKSCFGEVRLGELKEKRNGLACSLSLSCLQCHEETQFWTSDKSTTSKLNDINLRMLYGLRCIGKGAESGKLLCAMLNLPKPNSAYTRYTKVVSESVYDVAEKSMQKAVQEAILHNEVDGPNTRDLSVAYDGTWQKRGYKSKNGVCTLTSLDTGKVLDVEVLTKFCSGCVKCGASQNKKDNHVSKCIKNYEGSSGGMETVAAVSIFNRSEVKRGVRYEFFLGDGDSKAHQAVVESDPYNGLEVKKLECVGHIQKRMGTRLRNFKIKNKGLVLSDGKGLKGAGRLTDKVIDQLQGYYGAAIRSNECNLDGMRRAVWAIWCHKSWTDENPKHALCPDPPNTWCPYRKAEEAGTLGTYKHKNSIPTAIMDAIKPIFGDLCKASLLKKCLHGKTQNVNEAFNNVLWTRIPKNVFVGRITLELGAFDAVATFNDGNASRIKVLQHLGINDIGSNTILLLQQLDTDRIKRAELSENNATKEARVKKRRRNLGLDEEVEEDYLPGGF